MAIGGPPPRILFIRLSALGDVVHALPVLAAARAEFPDAFIGWLVEDRAAPILQDHPLLNALHVLPRKALRENWLAAARGPIRDLVRELRAQRYDAAIDFQGLTKSAIWTRISGARRRVGFRGEDAREISRWFYNEAISPSSTDVHVIQKNLSLLRAVGIENPLVRFPAHLPTSAHQRAETIWGEADPTFPRIVMNPGAGWPTKQWPAENYGKLAAELARRISARVALAWGPGEEPLVRAALSAAGAPESDPSSSIGPRPGVYLMPPTSFVELGAAVARAQLFIAGDTGPAHLAVALGVPTLGLYGASDPKRNGPWGVKNRVIQLTDPPCIPCWKTRCAWKEPLACLERIRVEQALVVCSEILSTTGTA